MWGYNEQLRQSGKWSLCLDHHEFKTIKMFLVMLVTKINSMVGVIVMVKLVMQPGHLLKTSCAQYNI